MSGFKFFAIGAISNGGKGHLLTRVQKVNVPWQASFKTAGALKTFTGIGSDAGKANNPGSSSMAILTLGVIRYTLVQVLKFMILYNAYGTVSISTYREGYLQDSATYEKFYFQPQNFEIQFKDMLKYLEKVGLNYIGPLSEMVKTLSDWDLGSRHVGGRYYVSFDFRW